MNNKSAIALEFLKISSRQMSSCESTRDLIRQSEIRLGYIKRAIDLGCNFDDMAIVCGVTREHMKELILIASTKIN